jgi:hypothetical protein
LSSRFFLKIKPAKLEKRPAEEYKIYTVAHKNIIFTQPNQAHFVDKLENPKRDKRYIHKGKQP